MNPLAAGDRPGPPVHRLCLLAFGLFTWSVSTFAAADPSSPNVVVDVASAQSGLGVATFVAGLLPGGVVGFSPHPRRRV